jgi:acetyl esterase/lipase
MRMRWCAGLLCGWMAAAGLQGVHAEGAAATDVAAAFGAREAITSVRLSPDGQSVALVQPGDGTGNTLVVLRPGQGAKPVAALGTNGKPFHLNGCSWVANDRLVCEIYGLVPDPNVIHGLLPLTRVIAVNADGSNFKQLSTTLNENSRGYLLSGGSVLDWLPDQDGSVLMAREYRPDTHGHMGSDAEGLGVDLVDTRTLAISHVIPAHADAFEYLSDGRGTVRIMGSVVRNSATNEETGELRFSYRLQGSSDWHTLSVYTPDTHSGFRPIAVDHDLNLAYGWQELNGRNALYSMTLDGSPHQTLIFARQDVDLGALIRIGRRNRVVGVRYVTDRPYSEFLQDDFKQMLAGLHGALTNQPLMQVLDSNVDESKMLIFAGSDNDPGSVYIFDRKLNQLRSILRVRPQLAGMTLARVKPITYPSADGVMIPGYLTLPPGRETAQGLPAIVLPHGGPSARDDWGFDWLAQAYAALGFAVLQPNYRGSSGYGDEWFQQNGFRSWNIAVGDVVAAGHWLVNSGIADPAKLAIVGWSYGGYAALQSVDIDANVFKAIIAIAPVTDLAALKEEHRGWADYTLRSNFIGEGPHMREGSPITHADKFKQPVLIFHGTVDRNVGVDESIRMAKVLKSAGVQCELVTFEGRDHQLDDSEVRTDMLRKSDAFLKHAFGMSN